MRRTGAELHDAAEVFYEANPDLLRAHERAAAVMNAHGAPASAKFLTEFARYMRSLGRDGVDEMARAYDGVGVESHGDFAIPNATSPWLTRHLDGMGFTVTRSRSKMDGRKERPQWNGENYVLFGMG